MAEVHELALVVDAGGSADRSVRVSKNDLRRKAACPFRYNENRASDRSDRYFPREFRQNVDRNLAPSLSADSRWRSCSSHRKPSAASRSRRHPSARDRCRASRREPWIACPGVSLRRGKLRFLNPPMARRYRQRYEDSGAGNLRERSCDPCPSHAGARYGSTRRMAAANAEALPSRVVTGGSFSIRRRVTDRFCRWSARTCGHNRTTEAVVS